MILTYSFDEEEYEYEISDLRQAKIDYLLEYLRPSNEKHKYAIMEYLGDLIDNELIIELDDDEDFESFLYEKYEYDAFSQYESDKQNQKDLEYERTHSL